MRGSVGKSTRLHGLSKSLCLSLLAVAVVFATFMTVVLVAVGPASASETTTSEISPVGVATSDQPTEAAGPNVTLAPPSTTSTTKVVVKAGPQVQYSAEELEFVQLLNDYRVSNGLEPLMLSDTLTVACDRHTSDMVTYGFLNHFTGYYRASSGSDLPLDGTRSDYFATGTDPGERMAACGYDYKTVKGENLAAGQSTAADALQTLKDSPTHNTNLLHPDFKVIGIAVVHVSGSDWGYYWTTDFGGYADATAHAVTTMVADLD